MVWLVLSVILIGLCTVWFYISMKIKPPNFPPGPSGILSIQALIDKSEPFPSKVMIKLSKKYGPVVGMQASNRLFACVSGYEAVRDILNNPHLSGRPDAFEFNLKTSGLRRGLLFTDGELWKEQRRFTMRYLRDFGFGRTSLEGIILDEVADLVAVFEKEIDANSDGNILLDDPFTIPVLSVLWAVIAGERFNRDCPKTHEMIEAVTGFSRANNGGPSILTVFPFARYIAPEMTGFNNMARHISCLRKHIQDTVRHHRETREPGHRRDFLDVYLENLDEEDSQTKQDPFFSEEQMMGVIIDIFIAGAETTSYSLGFAIMLMIANPDVQAKVQEEIDQLLGGRSPSLADRSSLPYTEATLLEIQRLGVVAPVTVPHVAMEDTTCQGYCIPKDTVTFINLWSVHMDPETWPDPEKFQPERHFDSKGNVVRSDHIMTFGQGKRSCMGEALAKSSIFLIFTSLMQHFRFSKSTDTSDPNLVFTLDPIVGLTLAPKPCLANIQKRHQL